MPSRFKSLCARRTVTQRNPKCDTPVETTNAGTRDVKFEKAIGFISCTIRPTGSAIWNGRAKRSRSSWATSARRAVPEIIDAKEAADNSRRARIVRSSFKNVPVRRRCAEPGGVALGLAAARWATEARLCALNGLSKLWRPPSGAKRHTI